MKKSICILTITIFFLVFGLTHMIDAFAKDKKKERRFPIGCTQTNFQAQHSILVLNTNERKKTNAIFFIHNISDKVIELALSQIDSGPYIVHIQTSIRPNSWNVFSTTKRHVTFICSHQPKPGSLKKAIECKATLDICEFPNVVFGENNAGNYWIVTNKTRNGSVRFTTRHGILLRGFKKTSFFDDKMPINEKD